VVSGEYDPNTPGGRLDTFRPLDPETGEPIHTYQWAEQIGIGKDVLGYVLRNAKKPKWDIVITIEKWMAASGYNLDDIWYWKHGKDIPKKAQRVEEKVIPRAGGRREISALRRAVVRQKKSVGSDQSRRYGLYLMAS